MRVGIIQPSYIPWRGYFDFISSVDAFVFLDDVQYTLRDWRNRNRIKTQQGLRWLTVSVRSPHRQRICDVEIDNSTQWQKKHTQSLRHAYGAAPFFRLYFEEFSEIIRQEHSLSALDIRLTRWIMDKLDIHVPTFLSSEMAPRGTSTARLMDILLQLGADAYLSGPSAAAYLDTALFRQHNIQLEFKSYDYIPYPQMYGPFVSTVSVLDLLFNTGPEASKYLHSTTPDKKVA